MEQLTNLSTIRALCEKYDFSLAKKLGQHFLTNPGICPKICDAAGITKDSNVLEIGPGFGTLTAELASRAKRVLALEVDARLLPVLDETLAGLDNVTVVKGDVLKIPLAPLLAEYFDGPVIVCANLPYNITSPIIMRLLEEDLPLCGIVVMIQKEAAQRMVAAPGTREAGAITYAIHYYTAPKIAFSVSPGSFTPAPKVTSAVVHFTPHAQRLLDGELQRQKRLFSLIRASFSQRRKTLANAAGSTLGIDKALLADALAKAHLPPKSRAEDLTLEDYIALEAALWE